MRPRLRLFTGEGLEGSSATDNQVSVRFGEITRALADAVRWDRTWLHDFEDDQVSVSSDLYEVISHFTRLRPSALLSDHLMPIDRPAPSLALRR